MSSSSSSKISPPLLIVIVVLAVAFFVFGLVHVLFRFVFRKRRRAPPPQDDGGSESSSSLPDRQLQQLFHQHDSGLDQVFIDALPVFLYADLVAAKEEPFDCAVCLCEFDAAAAELRLLPVCGHAFHLACIDTWLLSNSTCPLCRGSLFPQGSSIEHIAFNLNDQTQDEEEAAGEPHASAVEETTAEKAFPVRLGKFRNLGNGHGDGEGTTNGDSNGRIVTENWRLKEGESSISLDTRRCFSMGSYQYVVADAELHVAFRSCCTSANRGREAIAADEAADGKRLGVGGRRESFSVSKIWLWSNNTGKVPVRHSDTSDLEANSPWKKMTGNW